MRRVLTLLTGPNMAGKSTFLRQNALLVMLAQMGSFVPAERAEIGIVDRVFSLVSARPMIWRAGARLLWLRWLRRRPFCSKPARALWSSSTRIGRGTATFDGLSIAWACVEYLHDITGCRTLFATHYHELTALAARLDGLSNASMRVREHEGKLVFFARSRAKARPTVLTAFMSPSWPACRRKWTARARHVLHQLEENDAAGQARAGQKGSAAALDGLPLFDDRPVATQQSDALRDAMADLDPDRLSPREALDWLYRLQALSKA